MSTPQPQLELPFPGDLPANVDLIWLRATMVDTNGQPLSGDVVLTPNITSPGRMVDYVAKVVIDAASRRISLDANGHFEVRVFPTDDPDITPVNWNYTVQEPTGAKYIINVPYDTPLLNTQPNADPSDPLYDDRVVELYNVVPVSDPAGGTARVIAGPAGKGISSTEVVPDLDGNGDPNPNAGHLVIHYTDDTQMDVGTVNPGPQGDSAYETWVAAGHSGTKTDFLNSLVGADGTTGPQGIPGDDGAIGPAGADGLSIIQLSWNANKHLITTMSDSSTIDAGLDPASLVIDNVQSQVDNINNDTTANGGISDLASRLTGIDVTNSSQGTDIGTNSTDIGSLNDAVGMPYSNSDDIVARLTSLESALQQPAVIARYDQLQSQTIPGYAYTAFTYDTATKTTPHVTQSVDDKTFTFQLAGWWSVVVNCAILGLNNAPVELFIGTANINQVWGWLHFEQVGDLMCSSMHVDINVPVGQDLQVLANHHSSQTVTTDMFRDGVFSIALSFLGV